MQPRGEVVARALRVALVAGQEIGGGEDGEVMVTRELPDVLDVADRFFRAMIDLEAVPRRWPRSPRSRIGEPVRICSDVIALDSECLPPSLHELVGGRNEAIASILVDRGREVGRQSRPKRSCSATVGKVRVAFISFIHRVATSA